jgi:ribosomal protein S8E
MLRLLPSMRSAGGFIGLTVSTIVGSLAIIAMSSWLNAAALAGSAAVEQHLELTVRDYQTALEQAHDIAISAQALGREVRRAREAFEALAEQERSGELSGTAGEGAVYRILRQKTEELQSLETQITEQQPLIEIAFEQGNEILGRMRALTVAAGPVEQRSVAFSEESVRLAGVVSNLNQYSVALLVARAAADLPASVVLPELDGRSAAVRNAQSSTIVSGPAQQDFGGSRSPSLGNGAAARDCV